MADDPPNVMAAPQLTGAPPGASLIHIADRVIGRPLLIHPTKAEVILHVLEGRIPIDGALAPLGPEANRFVGSWIGADGKSRKFKTQKGVAIVSVVGSLVNRGAWIGAYSGMTSYEGVIAQLNDADADPEIHTLVIEGDSPGGEATGMFAAAAKVADIATRKRVIAVVNDMAASAMYGLISGATEIVVSPTSIVGSIGVVLTHLDRSGELASKGIRPTLIYAGRHKVDGNPFGPLSEGVKADLQAEVAKFYDQFVSLVAQGRGEKLTEMDARATEARTFIGQEAVDRGLADRVASFDAVLASLQSQQPPRAGTATKGTRSMSGENTITQEAHTAAVNAARADGHKAGLAEGKTLGATEATARIGAILGCEEAKGNPLLAAHFAFKTSLSADDAKTAMAAAGPAASAQPQEPSQSIEERQRAAGDFGAQGGPVHNKAERSADVWKQAVKGEGVYYG